MTTTQIKLLILDAIAEVALGADMRKAFEQMGVNVEYADCRNFQQKKLYKFRAAYRKALNRMEGASDRFYHFPKLLESAFERYIADERPTHILVIGFIYKHLSPIFLKEIKRKYKLSIYLYDTDSCNLYPKRREFLFFIENELPLYTEIFSFSKVTTKFFVETKHLEATFLPFAATPLTVVAKPNPQLNALFVGSGDLRRILLLENIRDDITIYGNRWERNYPLMSDGLKKKVTDKAVWGEQLHELLVNAKIIININRTHFYGAGTGVNLRIFEALAVGGFLLTDYCDELEELFEIGQEIEVFRSNQELIDKVNYYLANPVERLKIAKCGHVKFLRSHTWQARVSEIMNKFNKA